ncbi:MAG: hypothetical protein JEZ14_04385 [Marinilabiliaceae bacterium]|nr:hypothetical protein [Marinilabiliaceae bacterium]
MKQDVVIYHEKEIIKSFHVDFKQQLRLSALFSFMQEAAYKHAEALGMGFSQLSNENHFWVLSRAIIHVDRYPKWNEKILVETWPRGFKQLFGMRDFKITDEKGEQVAAATTAWLVLDTKTRRPVRANEVMKHLPDNGGRKVLEDFPNKLPALSQNHPESKVFRADYSCIDQNGHVNNTKYIDWITDCFDKVEHEGAKIKSLQINFNAEMHWDDHLEMLFEEIDNKVHFSGQSEVSGRNIFQARLSR